jgi:pyruvate dehydrogenase E2 component (dihydrolipoamide acetyltransferase)
MGDVKLALLIVVGLDGDATMTYEADADGLLKIVAAEGQTLAVGATIARLLTDAQELADTADRPAPESRTASANGGSASPPPAPTGSRVPATLRADRTAATTPDSTRIKASPIARRIARERGIDLATLVGTGPNGRIVRADVDNAPVLADDRPTPNAVATSARAAAADPS